MKKLQLTSTFLFLFAALSVQAQGSEPVRNSVEKATYRVTFENLWNKEDHLAFPSNAHFSPIVAVSHTSDFHLFRLGGLASDGFKSLSETGNTRSIRQEIGRAGDSILDLRQSEALFPTEALNSLSFDIEVSREHPLFSLTTMIAPSPDWTVGIDSLSLVQGNEFVESYTTQLFAVNAGTENGDFGGNFSLNNRASNPQEPISGLYRKDGLDKAFARVIVERVR